MDNMCTVTSNSNNQDPCASTDVWGRAQIWAWQKTQWNFFGALTLIAISYGKE